MKKQTNNLKVLHFFQRRTKFFFLICLVIFVSQSAFSQSDSKEYNINNSFFAGAHLGINSYSEVVGIVNIGRAFPIKNHQLMVRAGYVNTGERTSFDSVESLNYKTHGIFADGNWFFSKWIYAGVGFGVNMNWVSDESKEKYKSLREKDPPNYFTGFVFKMQVGAAISISDRFTFLAEASLPIHNYKIATGDIYLDNSTRDTHIDDFALESQLNISPNISAGIAFSFK